MNYVPDEANVKQGVNVGQQQTATASDASPPQATNERELEPA